MAIKDLKLIEAFHSIHSGKSIEDVSNLFRESEIRYIVVHENNTIKGIITKNELLEAYINGISLAENVTDIINTDIDIVKGNYSLDTLTTLLKINPQTNIIITDSRDKVKGLLTKTEILDFFCDEIRRKVSGFTNVLEVEAHTIGDIPNSTKYDFPELMESLDKFNLWNKELVQIFENSPNSFVLQDAKGNTLRVNKEFENITGLKKEEVIGRNVKDMEEEGIYNPAVGILVLKEKRKIAVLQKLKNGKEALVTGVPIYDDGGNIFRVVLNAIDYKELQVINQYYARQKAEDEEQKDAADTTIVYESESMKKIYQLTSELKNVDSTILITGESGVGKGVLARYIHENGIRKNGRMVEINCGAIPETLLESELLGYEAGAFTGANKSGKPGLIELAHNGTLFLDEIGEMSIQLQVKLLQVIQEKRIMRVGGVKPVDVDIRIIAATNRDLQEAVKNGKFRVDLFYRLNVIPINIPPLRDRELDIISMSKYFLDKYNRKYHKNVIIGTSILNEMVKYDWPGNVRELENAIERLVVTNPSTTIERKQNKCEMFDFNIFSYADSDLNLGEGIMPLEEAKKEVEKKIIKMAYEKYKSSYKVAKMLQISQATASRKIREYIE